MAIPRAWLLTILLAITIVTNIASASDQPTSTSVPTTSTIVLSRDATTDFVRTSNPPPRVNVTTTGAPSAQVTSKSKFMDYARPFTNVKDILLHEIRTLDKDASDDKIQEEVAETFKAEAQRDRANLRGKSPARSSQSSTTEKAKVAAEGEQLRRFGDIPYEDNLSDEYDEDENADDDEDEDDDDEDTGDELDDDENVMTQCPDYCKCSGQYAAAMTATCNKLVDGQNFEPGIVHLRIENAGEIRLGPNALRARGLQQLESITIIDTHIVEIDHTAFNGVTYLFAVNLTHNTLQDIHPNTFQNNTQLSLLAISDNPLKHMQDAKSTKHYLLHAPSVTDFDFSNNGLLRLKRTAFAKMNGLHYINLRGNRFREIDSAIFDSLDSLEEIDLSDNFLNDLPIDLFDEKGVQVLRISGNNLSTLATISAPKLNELDVSRNRIKVIAKEDLDGVPLLDQLYIKSNNLKRIHQHAFSNLEQLTNLDISDNKLSLLTEHHFRANPRLQVLLLNDNPALQTLPVFKVSGLEYETFSIFRFECANCGLNSLQPGTFDEMPALTRLNLARNLLSGLPDGLLGRLSSLRELDLSDNLISNLQPNMFRGATSLSKLSLAHNPLKTLQVTPFLKTPGLVKLDVSRCNLERVWSEARMPLKSLRSLSVRGNLLRRITVEELRATPKLAGLDLSHNPLDCDDEFNEAVQWLTDHGVAPKEALRYFVDFADNDFKSTGISQWTDLAKTVCDGIADGPPPRPVPSRSPHLKDAFLGLDMPEDSDSLLRNEIDKDEKFLKLDIDHGMRQADDPRLLEDQEYDEDVVITTQYHPWHSGALWMGITIMLITLVVLLLAAHVALCLAKKRGRSPPVLRRPMILRQGLVDNKNCGLVYKPLQEEIATPHMPKRGSFYSSSTFHYDKIVPESV